MAKENIRLWFEFYKLGLNDPKFKDQIGQSSSYYRDWGDCRNVTFDKWWKLNKHLFDEVTVREVTEIDNDSSSVYLKVPLALPVTDVMERIKKIIQDKQEKARKLYTKSKGAPVGAYQLTPGTEFRSKRNNHTLLIYRDCYLKKGKPPINANFVESVQDFYKQRTKAKTFKSPPSSFAEGAQSSDDAIRSCRRYIKDAERLILAAAKGDFPGRS